MPNWLSTIGGDIANAFGAVENTFAGMGRGITALPKRPKYGEDVAKYGSDVSGYTAEGEPITNTPDTGFGGFGLSGSHIPVPDVPQSQLPPMPGQMPTSMPPPAQPQATPNYFNVPWRNQTPQAPQQPAPQLPAPATPPAQPAPAAAPLDIKTTKAYDQPGQAQQTPPPQTSDQTAPQFAPLPQTASPAPGQAQSTLPPRPDVQQLSFPQYGIPGGAPPQPAAPTPAGSPERPPQRVQPSWMPSPDQSAAAIEQPPQQTGQTAPPNLPTGPAPGGDIAPPPGPRDRTKLIVGGQSHTQPPPPPPSYDELLRRLMQDTSTPTQLPKRPALWREVLGDVVGSTVGGAPFAPLVKYGPGRLQQMQQMQLDRQRLEDRLKLAPVLEAAINREQQQASQQQTRTETAHKDELAAYDSRVNNIATNKGWQLSPGQQAPGGYPTVTIKNPRDGQVEVWVTPTKSQQVQEEEDIKDTIKHRGDTELPESVTSVLGLKKGKVVSESMFEHYVALAVQEKKDKQPNEWSMALRAAGGKGDGTDSTEIYQKALDLAAQTTKAGKFAPVINVNTQQATDPAFLNGAADTVFQNPKAFENFSGAVKNAVADTFTKKYGLPAPSKIDPQVEDQAEQSLRALEQLSMVRQLMKDPVVQKRMGPAMGRVGNAEQEVGATAGLSPADAQKIQRFRGALNMLVFGEGKAIFGARMPEGLMEQFKSTTPNVRQALPMLQGAMQSSEDFANNTIIGAEKARFGNKVRPGFKPGQPMGVGAGPADTGAANPNPGGYIVGHTYGGQIYLGPDPNKASSWKPKPTQ